MHQTRALVSGRTERTASTHAQFGLLLIVCCRNLPGPQRNEAVYGHRLHHQFSQLEMYSHTSHLKILLRSEPGQKDTVKHFLKYTLFHGKTHHAGYKNALKTWSRCNLHSEMTSQIRELTLSCLSGNFVTFH